MNVLILTPDRVGSTLLQRLLTVYMSCHDYDKPVINVHELTNGLVEYFNTDLNQFVIGRAKFFSSSENQYFQTLPEIVNMLERNNHYKTARLAQYHINMRYDSIDNLLPFYRYLNDNFFVISARRDNLFEHAISWCIKVESGRLNVFSHDEKTKIYADIKKNKIKIATENLNKYLLRYKNYLSWVDDHFDVRSYFNYERDMPRVEDYILGLNIFGSQSRKTWKDVFGIEFNDWNKCHYFKSDSSGLSQIANSQPQLLTDKSINLIDNQSLVSNLALADQHQTFLTEYNVNYEQTQKNIDHLVNIGIMPNGIPIKLQTLAEKGLMISNFSECIDFYNQWVDHHNIGTHVTKEGLSDRMKEEIMHWYNTTPVLAQTQQNRLQ